VFFSVFTSVNSVSSCVEIAFRKSPVSCQNNILYSTKIEYSPTPFHSANTVESQPELGMSPRDVERGGPLIPISPFAGAVGVNHRRERTRTFALGGFRSGLTGGGWRLFTPDALNDTTRSDAASGRVHLPLRPAPGSWPRKLAPEVGPGSWSRKWVGPAKNPGRR